MARHFKHGNRDLKVCHTIPSRKEKQSTPSLQTLTNFKITVSKTAATTKLYTICKGNNLEELMSLEPPKQLLTLQSVCLPRHQAKSHPTLFPLCPLKPLCPLQRPDKSLYPEAVVFDSVKGSHKKTLMTISYDGKMKTIVKIFYFHDKVALTTGTLYTLP